MSDKKLLEESTIRRFMQLANIKPINDGLIAEAKKAEEKKKAHKEEEKKEKKVEEGLEEMGMPTSAPAMEEEGYHEEGLEEEAGMEGGEGEGGGDVRAALEQIKAGVDMLLGMIEGGAGVELGVEEEPEAGEGEEGEAGMEDEAPAEEGLEEVAHETAKMEEEGLEEKKGLPPALKKAIAAKKEKTDHKGDGKEMEEEALAEELTRRVAARLVAEMKKSGGKWGSGPKGAKPKAHGKPKSPTGYKPAKKA